MNQRVGYACVSTDDQRLDLQRAALHLSGVQSIYEEKASGKAGGRPELNQCLKSLRAGDTLVVWRLDRLGCSLSELVRVVAELEDKGISFESITEKIETAGNAGKWVSYVFAALAVFERNLIRERTHAGLIAARARARARGRAGGRKPKLDAQQISEIQRLMADPNIPVSQIAERYKVSRTTLYKVAPRSSAATSSGQTDASAITPRENA